MDDIVSVVRRLGWPADRLEDLFRAPFWKVMAGVVIATLLIVAVAAMPAAARDKLKVVAFIGALAIATLEVLQPLERSFPWGERLRSGEAMRRALRPSLGAKDRRRIELLSRLA